VCTPIRQHRDPADHAPSLLVGLDVIHPLEHICRYIEVRREGVLDQTQTGFLCDYLLHKWIPTFIHSTRDCLGSWNHACDWIGLPPVPNSMFNKCLRMRCGRSR
jgi:hypothetical protein